MKSKTDKYLRKIAFVYLKSCEYSVNFIVLIYSIFFRKNKTKRIHNIATYWYYPPDLTGSNLRMGGWEKYFIGDGYVYKNFYINSLKEYVVNVENGNWTRKYLFFSKCLCRRLPQILKAHRYDVLWIDRGIIPYYPRKNAFIEKCLKKVVSKLVIDTTDGGDYLSNEALMEDTLKQADEITVGYKYLKDLFSSRFKVSQVYWTIETKNYLIKDDYSFKGIPVIGWMGSPGNFKHVLSLSNVLADLSSKHVFKFRYICRNNFDDKLPGVLCEHRTFDIDYYKNLYSFDIGISPFQTENLRTKGKIAMKHQEFLLCGIPQVCSPVAISEFVDNNVHVLIARNNEEWYTCLDKLLTDNILRHDLGKNSIDLFRNYYCFEQQYPGLKNILTTL